MKKNSFIKMSDFNSPEDAKRYFHRVENNLPIYDTFEEPTQKSKTNIWATLKLISYAILIFVLTLSISMVLLYLLRS